MWDLVPEIAGKLCDGVRLISATYDERPLWCDGTSVYELRVEFTDLGMYRALFIKSERDSQEPTRHELVVEVGAGRDDRKRIEISAARSTRAELARGQTAILKWHGRGGKSPAWADQHVWRLDRIVRERDELEQAAEIEIDFSGPPETWAGLVGEDAPIRIQDAEKVDAGAIDGPVTYGFSAVPLREGTYEFMFGLLDELGRQKETRSLRIRADGAPLGPYRSALNVDPDPDAGILGSTRPLSIVPVRWLYYPSGEGTPGGWRLRAIHFTAEAEGAAPDEASAPAVTRAGDVAWGEPKGGVALGLSLSTHRVGYGEEMTITFHVKNAGTAPVKMIPPGGDLHQELGYRQVHQLRFLPEGEDVWRACYLHPDMGERNKLVTLKPGDVRRAGFSSEGGRMPSPHGGGDAWLAQRSTWPLLPGRYRVRAMVQANRGAKGAEEAGLWVDWAFSGELELTVAPYPFVESVEDRPEVSQREIDRLHLQARKRRGGDRELMEIGDRKACLALIALLRSGSCGRNVVRFLGERFGDEIIYDLVRASDRRYGISSRFIRAAGEALGRLGTEAAISAVDDLLKSPHWGATVHFVRGLGQSQTRESLELLGRLAREGSTDAVTALGKRQDKDARALLWAAVKARSRVSDHAARTLAAIGDRKAVAWLASHWDWLNGLAFLSAPIDWPSPGKGALSKDEATAVALEALPALSQRRPLVTRYFGGRWYVVSAAGRPEVAGYFHYVILNGATGEVLDKREARVLR
ncbi:MAG: HEAT repeat domain-containing protein [Planctomycetota bacterium]